MKNKLLHFLEHSPRSAIMNPDLLGWTLESGEFICSSCAARLMARGCWNLKASPVWTDAPKKAAECLLIEGH